MCWWNVLMYCDFAVITYRVLIVNVRQSSISSCRPYLLLSGTLADTQPIYFSNERFEVLFQVGCRLSILQSTFGSAPIFAVTCKQIAMCIQLYVMMIVSIYYLYYY